MNKKLKTVENGIIKEYNILLEFTSNDTNKKYVFYYNENKNEIYISYYRIDGEFYILTPIKDEEEINMCKNILEDIKNYN